MDNPDFYDQIMNIIEDFGNERYLLFGDFNLVLCLHIDWLNNYHSDPFSLSGLHIQNCY
jgi:hypothetical protein